LKKKKPPTGPSSPILPGLSPGDHIPRDREINKKPTGRFGEGSGDKDPSGRRRRNPNEIDIFEYDQDKRKSLIDSTKPGSDVPDFDPSGSIIKTGGG